MGAFVWFDLDITQECTNVLLCLLDPVICFWSMGDIEVPVVLLLGLGTYTRYSFIEPAFSLNYQCPQEPTNMLTVVDSPPKT